MANKFAIIGCAGFVAPRHIEAIKNNGGELVVALDKSDSVGILDKYFDKVDFFTEFERFDRHINKLQRQEDKKISFVSICSPNYLHDSHIRFALRNGADAICEKPIVLNPWNLDALEEVEKETGRKIYTILQLRLHPEVIKLKQEIESEDPEKRHKLKLDYITPRGNWYAYSWKGDIEKSGGLITNIGVHLFDMLLWLFGEVESFEILEFNDKKVRGTLKLKKADVEWFLSLDRKDIPSSVQEQGNPSYRLLTMDGREIEFSKGFTDLHTRSYEEILAGRGFGIKEVKKTIELIHQMREKTKK